MTVFVLWENHATGPIHRFGPHAFLVACVAAQLQMERFELLRSERVMGRACNGNRNGNWRALEREVMINLVLAS